MRYKIWSKHDSETESVLYFVVDHLTKMIYDKYTSYAEAQGVCEMLELRAKQEEGCDEHAN